MYIFELRRFRLLKNALQWKNHKMIFAYVVCARTRWDSKRKREKLPATRVCSIYPNRDGQTLVAFNSFCTSLSIALFTCPLSASAFFQLFLTTLWLKFCGTFKRMHKFIHSIFCPLIKWVSVYFYMRLTSFKKMWTLHSSHTLFYLRCS